VPSDQSEQIAKELEACSAAVDSALCTAAAKGRTKEVRRLLAAGADIEERSPQDESTPLHCAASSGRAAVVRLLLRKGADMSAENSLGATSLHVVARWGFEAVARLLIEHGADVSAKTTADGVTPEDVAVARSQPVVAALLKAEAARRADPSARGRQEPLPPKPQVAYIQHNPREFLPEVGLVAADRDGEKLQVKGQIPRNSSTGMHFQV
jgi:ankyrin repeat protein